MAIAPARAEDEPDASPPRRAASRDPDGDPLTYHYQWLRNGTEIAGATTSTLNLATAGNGDRGDKIRVEVYATDGRGAASDAAVQTVTVANTRADRRHASTIKPASPSTNDVLKADASRLRRRRRRRADLHVPVVPQRHRRSPARRAARSTSRCPGNGDLGDTHRRRRDRRRHVRRPRARLRAPRRRSPAPTRRRSRAPWLSRPPSPRTDQTVTATPSRLPRSRRRRAHLPLPVVPQRQRRSRAPTAAALNLSGAGAGDRGDAIRVEVTATDTHGATSDPAVGHGDRRQHRSRRRARVTVKPSSPSSDDFVTATASGFSDADGDALTYRYQWLRNGSRDRRCERPHARPLAARATATRATPIEVDVTAVDGAGGTSSHVRASQVVGSGASHAVASYGFEEAVGHTSPWTRAAATTATSPARRAAAAGRFGRALSFDGDGRHRHRPRRLGASPRPPA